MTRPLDGGTLSQVYDFVLNFHFPLSSFKFGVGRPMAQLSLAGRASVGGCKAGLDRSGSADCRRQARPVWNLELRGHPGLSRTAARSAARDASAGDVLEHRSRVQGGFALSTVGSRAQKAAHGDRE